MGCEKNNNLYNILYCALDDPNPGSNIRHTFGSRGGSTGRLRNFPGSNGSGRFPMMEGYAFISLDSHLGDPSDSQSVMYYYYYYIYYND